MKARRMRVVMSQQMVFSSGRQAAAAAAAAAQRRRQRTRQRQGRGTAAPGGSGHRFGNP